MNAVPFYKSLKFYLCLFSSLCGTVFLFQLGSFVLNNNHEGFNLTLIIAGLIISGFNIYFVTSRLNRELHILQQSIHDVILHRFSRKFKLKTVSAKDEIGQISHEVGLILDKAHQRTTEVMLRRQEVEMANRNMEQLAAMGREIISKLDITRIIQTTFNSVNNLMEASLLSVGIYNEIKQGLDLFGIRAGNNDVITGFDDMSDTLHWNVHVFNTQEEILCNEFDCRSDKHFSSILFNDPIEWRESFIYLPLTYNQVRIGVFTVQSNKRNAYNAYHLGLMRNLANYMTIAFQNAYAFKKIEQQKELLEEASEQLKDINDNLELQVHLRTIEITRQKEVIENKNIALERLSLVATKTENAIMIMDAQGNIQWLNECFLRIYNYTFEEFIEKRGNNLLNTSFHPDIKKIFDKCLSTRKPVYYEALNIKGDGSSIWTQTTLTPVLNDGNEITHLLTIDSDITRQKEYEIAITKQAEDITNSIIYAKRIQSAILPRRERFESAFNDYFLLYKPKAIVSGDFYWINKRNGKTLFAIADCTGHGVPGAFMCMLGVSLLNQIVQMIENVSAGEVLNTLRNNIKASLQNTETSDGMDIGFCIYDPQSNTLEYSGAFISLIMIRNNEIHEIRGNKMPIGVYINDNEPFTSKKIELQPRDRFYITTDGYADQFGGEKDSKFMMKRFKKLLLENHELPFTKQHEALERNINQWRGECYQVDDMCMLGFEF